MKKGLFVLAAAVLPSLVLAHPDKAAKTEFSVYVCLLDPFNDTFIGLGLTEDLASYNAHQQCANELGQTSLFCEQEDAVCSVQPLSTSKHVYNRSHLTLFDGSFQNREWLRVYDSIPNLAAKGFDDKTSSFEIPSHWTVRFFTEPNYQGDSFIVSGNDDFPNRYSNKISSVQVLIGD